VNYAPTHSNVLTAKASTQQMTINAHIGDTDSIENGIQEKHKKPEKSGLTQFVWLQTATTIYD